MDQEIIKPNETLRKSTQAVGGFGMLIAASGATLLALTMLGAAMGAIVWAVAALIGLPDVATWILMALGALPVIWATIWTAGRAWHVERRLEEGSDIDAPVFKLFHYWKKA
jgi:hypothetical protein